MILPTGSDEIGGLLLWNHMHNPPHTRPAYWVAAMYAAVIAEVADRCEGAGKSCGRGRRQ
jgi:hypothetical protein